MRPQFPLDHVKSALHAGLGRILYNKKGFRPAGRNPKTLNFHFLSNQNYFLKTNWPKEHNSHCLCSFLFIPYFHHVAVSCDDVLSAFPLGCTTQNEALSVTGTKLTNVDQIIACTWQFPHTANPLVSEAVEICGGCCRSKNLCKNMVTRLSATVCF